jgi:hypothetical protein
MRVNTFEVDVFRFTPAVVLTRGHRRSEEEEEEESEEEEEPEEDEEEGESEECTRHYQRRSLGMAWYPTIVKGRQTLVSANCVTPLAPSGEKLQRPTVWSHIVRNNHN